MAHRWQFLDLGEVAFRTAATATTSDTDTKDPAAIPEGGKFRVRVNNDGTRTLLDVPVLVEHTPPEDPEQYVGKDYFTAAIKRDQELRTENGHAGRVHIGHTLNGRGQVQHAKGAGYMALTRVGRMKLDGEEKDVLYADITITKQEYYDQIKNRELPYRSVEFSLNFDRPEVYSLAILESETPYFRMPMTTVGEEVPEGAIRRMEDNALPLVASVSRRKVQSVLMRMEGYTEKPQGMPKPTKPPEESQMVPMADPASMSPDQKLDAVLQMLGKLAEAIGGTRQTEEEQAPDEEPQEGPGEQDSPGPVVEEETMPETKNGPRSASGAKQTISDDQLSKMVAARVENSDLAKRVQTMEDERKREVAIRKAEDELRDAGYTIVEGEAAKTFDEFAQYGISAAERALKFHVEHSRAKGTPEPSDDPLRDVGEKIGDQTKAEDELSEWKNQGPDVYARALEQARLYDPEHNPNVSLKEFVGIRMEIVEGEEKARKARR